jgi:hypothetical protein
LPNMKTPTTIPLKAGKIALFKFGTDGTLTKNDANACLNNGVVASITHSRTYNTTELPDGNSQFPLGPFDSGVVDEYTVNMSSYQPTLYAVLGGEEITEEDTSDTMTMVEVEKTIDSSAYTVTLDPVYDGTGMVLTRGKDGAPYAKSESAPASGEFMVSGAALLFNSSAAGKEVLVTYDYTTAATVKSALPETIKRPYVHAIFSYEVTDEAQINTYRENLVIDRCKATGNLNKPPKQDEPAGWSFTLRVGKPRGGYDPVYTKIEKAAVS